MTETEKLTGPLGETPETGSRKEGWLAAGGLLGAVLASSCCIAPLALVMLGVSGAWIGTLTALEPYKPAFAAVAVLFIGLGFRHVYFASRPSCEPGSLCAPPRSSALAKTALWTAAILVLLALTIGWWAPLFY